MGMENTTPGGPHDLSFTNEKLNFYFNFSYMLGTICEQVCTKSRKGRCRQVNFLHMKTNSRTEPSKQSEWLT